MVIYNERELLLRCNALHSNERQIFYSKIPVNKQTDPYKNYGRIRQRTQPEHKLIYKMDFSNSLIIHEEKTKEITTVKEVWICDPNYHKVRRSFALIFSKNYQCFEKLYQTLERVFHQISKHFEAG